MFLKIIYITYFYIIHIYITLKFSLFSFMYSSNRMVTQWACCPPGSNYIAEETSIFISLLHIHCDLKSSLPYCPKPPGKNLNYIVLPFICYLGDYSMLDNSWVINVWSQYKKCNKWQRKRKLILIKFPFVIHPSGMFFIKFYYNFYWKNRNIDALYCSYTEQSHTTHTQMPYEYHHSKQ